MSVESARNTNPVATARLHAMLQNRISTASYFPTNRNSFAEFNEEESISSTQTPGTTHYTDFRVSAPTNPNTGASEGAQSQAATGRPAIRSVGLYMPCDEEELSPYQCLVRKQIEISEVRLLVPLLVGCFFFFFFFYTLTPCLLINVSSGKWRRC